MITKEVTKQEYGEYNYTRHIKTVYKVFGLTIYTIKTETLIN